MPTIEVSYGKKIGLRNYSSHSFSISIKTEVPTVADVEKLALPRANLRILSFKD